jgi:hypothetical protein
MCRPGAPRPAVRPAVAGCSVRRRAVRRASGAARAGRRAGGRGGAAAGRRPRTHSRCPGRPRRATSTCSPTKAMAGSYASSRPRPGRSGSRSRSRLEPSRQRQPEVSTGRMPEMMRRSSSRSGPGWLRGMTGSVTAHRASEARTGPPSPSAVQGESEVEKIPVACYAGPAAEPRATLSGKVV